MKNPLICAAVAVLSVSPSHAALVYAMDFENSPLGGLGVGDTVAPTSGTSGHNGSATVVGTGSSIVDAGNVSTFCGTMNMGQVIDLADNSWLDTGVDLGPNGSGTSLGIDSASPYTMAAWINYPSTGGDRFVFGTAAGSALHLGTRNTSYHSGHWSDDVGGLGTTATNAWHYVVFTNDAAGTQEVFVDGVSVGSGPGNNANYRDFANALLIGGARNDTGRDFIGQIAGVQVYDTVLSSSEQKLVAKAVAAPEPGRPVLLALAVLGLMLRRRR